MHHQPIPQGNSNDRPTTTFGGFVLVFGLGSYILVLGCCLLPSLIDLAPVDVNTFHVAEGTTTDEVRAKYGPPQERYRDDDGEESWYYHTDRLGVGITSIGVLFDRTGRVKRWWNV